MTQIGAVNRMPVPSSRVIGVLGRPICKLIRPSSSEPAIGKRQYQRQRICDGLGDERPQRLDQPVMDLDQLVAGPPSY